MAIEKEPEGKFLKARDLKLHYHEFGSGYPVICIHGAGPGASGWSNFKGNVDEFAKHYRTILFDMPQFGKSDKPVIKDHGSLSWRMYFERSWRPWESRKRTLSEIPWAARRR